MYNYICYNTVVYSNTGTRSPSLQTDDQPEVSH